MSVFSVLRIVAVLDISELDFTGTVLLDVLWGALEILLGIITACLPLLQPPLARTVGKDSAIDLPATAANRAGTAAYSQDPKDLKDPVHRSRAIPKIPATKVFGACITIHWSSAKPESIGPPQSHLKSPDEEECWRLSRFLLG